MSGRFGRVITAMATPFKQDGSLDVEGVRQLAQHLVDNGTDVVLAAGTTGESPTLTVDERERLWRAVSETVGAARAMAGTSTYATAESIELTALAEKCGVGSLLLVTPYYNKPTQEGMEAHFRAIAAATSLPCLLYNVPSRTGCKLNVATMVRLAEVDNIVGVKDAVGDMAEASNLRRQVADDFDQYSGDDKNLLPLLAVGGAGVVSVAAHLVGGAINDLVAAFDAGDTARARQLHLDNIELFEGLFATSSPILLKAAMAEVGLPGGPLRLPMVDASASEREFIRGVLARNPYVTGARGHAGATTAGERLGG
jgi:4-hydroxy-tetrahydrodipicolinate synthase